MTEDQKKRKAEFDALFARLPGKKVDRVRAIADALCCTEGTVRIWLVKPGAKSARAISASNLKLLERQFPPAEQP